MRGIFLLLFLNSLLFSFSTILDSKIYDRDDRVDVLLSLDKEFEGSINKHSKGKKTYLVITKIQIDKDETFELNKPFLKNINLYKNNETVIFELDTNDAEIETAKTTAGYGLRIRIKKQEQPAPKQTLFDKKTSEPKIAQNVTDMTDKYIIVGVFIVILFLVLIFLKSYNAKRLLGGGSNDSAKVIYLKSIDAKNKLVLVSFRTKEYLVLIGEHANTLLDKKDINDEDNFDFLLKKNNQKVDSIFSPKKTQR
ncbi:MAG: hypothetical protein QG567_340 [Campylobacterota bacterium]|nr:hypothetical protein [Campylobacterota bacterium]